jgi:4'-phosphopantetheinyl transferase
MESSSLKICGVWDASLSAAPTELPAEAVHLWQRELHESASDLEACRELLSAEERDKAMRYRIERPRSDYILTRGTLRFLLAQYLHLTPAEISFGYTQYGKPFLTPESDLRFNVSHSHGLALMGFVRQREIGVDVEQVRAQSDAKTLAERFFSVREREYLRDLSGDELHAAFFRCWTRKEAYIKAKGEGLSLPLHQFDVSIDPDPKQALLATRPDHSEANRWSILNVSAKSGYAAAFAVEKKVEPSKSPLRSY